MYPANHASRASLPAATTNVWTIGQQLLVKKLYPKPIVECFIYPFQRSDGFYNSLENETVPDD